jgi:hypothetical protein
VTDKRFVLGFAGGVCGMTPAQLAAFTTWVRGHAGQIREFRTGCSRGADEQATRVICENTQARIVAARLPRNRAESALAVAVAAESITTPRKDALLNPVVVEGSDIVCVAPPDGPARGGTYHTFKAARWAGKVVLLLWPDGTVETRKYIPREDYTRGREKVTPTPAA